MFGQLCANMYYRANRWPPSKQETSKQRQVNTGPEHSRLSANIDLTLVKRHLILIGRLASE